MVPDSDRDIGEPPKARGRNDGCAWLFLAPYLVLFGVFVLRRSCSGSGTACRSGNSRCQASPSSARQLQGSVHGRLPDLRILELVQATGIFTGSVRCWSYPLAVALVMNEKFPGARVPHHLLAPYGWRRGGRRDVALPLDRNIGGQRLRRAIGLPGDTLAQLLPPAWIALVGVTIWWTLGFNAVIYIAGLQDIPRELYDAARSTAPGVGRSATSRCRPAPGDDVRHAHDHRLGQHVGQAFIMTNGAPGRRRRPRSSGSPRPDCRASRWARPRPP